MPRPTVGAGGLVQRLVVVTDVDASLLEPGTRSVAAERAALEFLAERGVPVVINSSRTRAEIERLHETLQLLTPFICEHGNALFLPFGAFPFPVERAQPAVGGEVVEFGRRYHGVVDVLRQTAAEQRIDIVGFADLSIENVARELNVPIVEAQLAKLREYTELFRIDDQREAARSRLFKALRRRGVRCTEMGRLHLASAAPDRAESLRMLRDCWRQAWGDPIIVGFGDSDDDAAWLQQADVAVIVQHKRTGVPARLLARLPTAHVTRWPGRQGWSEAILDVVGGLLTPPRSGYGRDIFSSSAPKRRISSP